MGSVDCRMADCAVGRIGIKARVEGWSQHMAAETKVGNALVSQHMLVGGSMHFMTSRASFDA